MDLLATVFEALEDAGIDEAAVRFVYRFGSSVDDPANARDIDVCVSLEVDEPERAEYRLRGRVPDEVDIAVFEALPVRVRKAVFAGELLYRRDDSVYDIAVATFREFDDYEPLYEAALG